MLESAKKIKALSKREYEELEETLSDRVNQILPYKNYI